MEDTGSTLNATGSIAGTMPIANASQLVFLQNQLVSIKLDESNHPMWKQQILTAIRGYGLEHFIDGSSSAPAMSIQATDTSQKTVNPEFILWQRQDQLLAAWILSSLSESILIQMVGLYTSREIWHNLEVNFTGQSKEKLLHYTMKLQTLKKGSLSMRDYLNQMKNCFDLLASAGKRITETEQVMHIMSGLGSEYDAIMVSVSSRLEP
ncbi:hypothetical protein DH2020_032230 [Rehmannia glutinosa]|uniref:Retrotransposon Copia-like N-terminal domain-containing protein n=1 Tax=Rehmannia glutinosa TaxID=99300 RepID=A0ABR0VI83_REHGL